MLWLWLWLRLRPGFHDLLDILILWHLEDLVLSLSESLTQVAILDVAKLNHLCGHLFVVFDRQEAILGELMA